MLGATLSSSHRCRAHDPKARCAHRCPAGTPAARFCPQEMLLHPGLRQGFALCRVQDEVIKCAGRRVISRTGSAVNLVGMVWVAGVYLGRTLSPGGAACREAEKEKGLLEKRLQRLEEARAAESAQAGAQLQKQRDAVAAELSAKDNKINDLVEELGATQALLNEKEHALQEVTGFPELSHPYSVTWQERPHTYMV